MAYGYVVPIGCSTDPLDHVKTSFELCHDQSPAFYFLLPFGTVGLRMEESVHRLVSHAAKCILLVTTGPHNVSDHRPHSTC